MNVLKSLLLLLTLIKITVQQDGKPESLGATTALPTFTAPDAEDGPEYTLTESNTTDRPKSSESESNTTDRPKSSESESNTTDSQKSSESESNTTDSQKSSESESNTTDRPKSSESESSPTNHPQSNKPESHTTDHPKSIESESNPTDPPERNVTLPPNTASSSENQGNITMSLVTKTDTLSGIIEGHSSVANILFCADNAETGSGDDTMLNCTFAAFRPMLQCNSTDDGNGLDCEHYSGLVLRCLKDASGYNCQSNQSEPLATIAQWQLNPVIEPPPPTPSLINESSPAPEPTRSEVIPEATTTTLVPTTESQQVVEKSVYVSCAMEHHNMENKTEIVENCTVHNMDTLALNCNHPDEAGLQIDKAVVCYDSMNISNEFSCSLIQYSVIPAYFKVVCTMMVPNELNHIEPARGSIEPRWIVLGIVVLIAVILLLTITMCVIRHRMTNNEMKVTAYNARYDSASNDVTISSPQRMF